MLNEHLFSIGLFAVLLFVTIYLWEDCNGEKNYICKVTVDPNNENFKLAGVFGSKPRQKRTLIEENEDNK